MKRGASYLFDEIIELFHRTRAHHKDATAALSSILIGTLQADGIDKTQALHYFAACWDEHERLQDVHHKELLQ